MFGVDGTFATHISFLYGYSAGDSQGELQKFHAWLNKDSETSSNMSWVWLVLKKAFPGQSVLWDPGAPRTAEEEDTAVVALLESLEEFIDSREGKGREAQRTDR
ncbi:hypothetical protein [Streptomyces sp. NBC_00342]|uniref:hypothetical protein n=1 Tax=Streptomyces sp. NBC_00342 TaxID=2975718 RepID=UPI002E2A584E|nr:hypothetical protein [Streptomyces sp. NBC_00342]